MNENESREYNKICGDLVLEECKNTLLQSKVNVLESETNLLKEILKGKDEFILELKTIISSQEDKIKELNSEINELEDEMKEIKGFYIENANDIRYNTGRY